MKEKIKQITELSEKYPDHEIIFAVNHDVIADDWGYWLCKIEQIEIDYFYKTDDEWVSGEDEIIEKLEIDFDDDKIIEDEFNKLLEKGEIKKAIIVYLEQG